MRGTQLLSVATFLSLAACQIDTGDFDSDFDEVGYEQQASIGGLPAQGEAHYEAVAAITILLPSGDNGSARTNYRYCTGVLIEEKTVMTAAACLTRNLEAELDDQFTDNFLDSASVFVQFGASISGSTEYVLDATFDSTAGASGTNVSVKGLTMHRYYEPGGQGQNNIALLSLSVAPGIAPIPVHATALTETEVGMPLELVGYGKKDNDTDPVEAFTARSVVTTPIVSVTADRITAGTETATTCYADSGGPGFMDFGSGPVVVSLNAFHEECKTDVNRQRIDLHAENFLNPFIKYATDGCAGCNDCEFNGTCKEECPTRDWDCPEGSSVGDACAQDGQCEEGGACIAATDDTTFTYCDKQCSPDNAGDCATDMTCVDDRCIFAGISPGSQGASCVLTTECRSGFCENSKCAYPCDAAEANACDEAGGFFCLPSIADGSTTVCRTELRTGGGGFCHIGTRSDHRSARNSLLAGLGLLLLVGLFRRRRID